MRTSKPPQRQRFANKVLATDGNKNAVREATLAKERNNQKSYQAAIDKIVCPAK